MTDDPFHALRNRFVMRARLDACRLRSAFSEGDRARIVAIAHALSGSAGTFGFADISRQAEALELAAESNDEAMVPQGAELLRLLAQFDD